MIEYVFKKPYETKFGVIPEGSTLREFRGFMYMNGGLIAPSYAVELRNIINDKDLHDEYLKDQSIIHNKV